MLSLNATDKYVMSYDAFLLTILPKFDAANKAEFIRQTDLEYDALKGYREPYKDIDDRIFNIFAKEVEFFRQLEFERHKFALKFGNQAKELFNRIDRNKEGFLNYNMFRRGFRRWAQFSTDEFLAILKRYSAFNS